MIISRAVAYISPLHLCSISWIVGMGHGFCTIISLSFQKSLTIHIPLFFFAMPNVGVAHLLSPSYSSSTLFSTMFLIALFVTSSCACGILYGLAWYGLALSFIFIYTGLPVYFPVFPWNRSSKLRSDYSSFFFLLSLKCCWFLWLTMSLLIIFQYMLSCISFALFSLFFSSSCKMLTLYPCHLTTFLLRIKSNLLLIRKSSPKMILYFCRLFRLTLSSTLLTVILLVNCRKLRPWRMALDLV
mgnify:CR=1 FL=1